VCRERLVAPGVFLADDLAGQRGGKGISQRVGGGVGQRGVDEAVGRATLAALSGGLLFLSDQPAALPSSSLAVVANLCRCCPATPPALQPRVSTCLGSVVASAFCSTCAFCCAFCST
jgi:hypothetical protein